LKTYRKLGGVANMKLRQGQGQKQLNMKLMWLDKWLRLRWQIYDDNWNYSRCKYPMAQPLTFPLKSPLSLKAKGLNSRIFLPNFVFISWLSLASFQRI